MQDFIDVTIKCLEDNAIWLGSLAALIAIIGVLWAVVKFLLPQKPKKPKKPKTKTEIHLPPAPQNTAYISTEEYRTLIEARMQGEQDQEKLKALQARVDAIEAAYAAEQKRAPGLEEQLKRTGNRIGGDRLNHAIALLHRFDYSEAEDIFKEIKADHALAVIESARASHGLGDIAAAALRWHAAAAHYQEAAGLHDCLEYNNEAGAYLYRIGKYTDAERYLRKALHQAEAEHGKDHSTFGTALNNLAGLLRDTGRYEDAEPFFRQALDNAEAALGKDHPNYGAALSNLAGLLQDTGRYGEAEPLYRGAVDVFERTLGADHPNTQKVKTNLERFLAKWGK